ncbi:MAG TPA: carboxypeptidase-like regulatory domain-containing protein [Ktedonobacterales bacterium]|nr:carboxypeptidase-like regulatory domain-containing protein [Ktedonobacterales bacterium]
MALGLALVPLMLAACASATAGAGAGGSVSGTAAHNASQQAAQSAGATQSKGTIQPAVVPEDGKVGTISGAVVAGPACPVQTAEDPCPPRPVAGGTVSIQTPSGVEVAHAVTDAGGHFTVRVAAGTYVVRVAASTGPLYMGQTTPGDVTVVAGQTTQIQLELDTGIR